MENSDESIEINPNPNFPYIPNRECMFLSCHVPVSEWILLGWVFFCELSGYGFESSCSHLKS